MDSHGHINDRGHIDDTGWVCDGVVQEKQSKQKVSASAHSPFLCKTLLQVLTFNTGLGARATNNPTLEHLQPRGHAQQTGAGCTLLSSAPLTTLLRTIGCSEMSGGIQRYILNGPGLGSGSHHRL